MSACWLCQNSTDEDVINFHAFAVQKAHVIEPLTMCQYFHELLVEKTEVVDIDTLPTVQDILLHLNSHVLHPNVRVSYILRSLLDLSETLKSVSVTKGEDDSPLIDVRSVALYLKVVSEIILLYKTADPTKMLFSANDTG